MKRFVTFARFSDRTIAAVMGIRVELIEGLETSRHEMRFLENPQVVRAREIGAGFNEPTPSDTDLRASMQNYLPMAKQMILMRGLGAYHDAPDKDLVVNRAMWLSPSYQRFNRKLAGAFDAAFGTRVREAAQAVRPFLKRDGKRRTHRSAGKRQPLRRFCNHKDCLKGKREKKEQLAAGLQDRFPVSGSAQRLGVLFFFVLIR